MSCEGRSYTSMTHSWNPTARKLPSGLNLITEESSFRAECFASITRSSTFPLASARAFQQLKLPPRCPTASLLLVQLRSRQTTGSSTFLLSMPEQRG
jgi:hypothetical protein